MQQLNRKEKFLVSNTLSCVPMLLEGQAVLIDLLNEYTVAGRISNADGYMNVHLNDAVYIDRNGLQYPFDEFMVKSRMIRQIHIPNNINMEQELQNWCEHGLRPKKLVRRKNEKRTFKQKRAEERHKEIVLKITEKQVEERPQKS